MGKDVELIPRSKTSGVHTPDIKMDGVKWEIKSPTGNSSRTIENNIRNALRQSDNIIIDLRRMHVNESKCLKEVERQVN